MRWECPEVTAGGVDEESKRRAQERRRKLVQEQKEELLAEDALGGSIECTVCDPAATFTVSCDTENFKRWFHFLFDSLGCEKVWRSSAWSSSAVGGGRVLEEEGGGPNQPAVACGTTEWEIRQLLKTQFDVVQSSSVAAAAVSQGHAKTTRRRTSWICLTYPG
jgi:hypothetical protein